MSAKKTKTEKTSYEKWCEYPLGIAVVRLKQGDSLGLGIIFFTGPGVFLGNHTFQVPSYQLKRLDEAGVKYELLAEE